MIKKISVFFKKILKIKTVTVCDKYYDYMTDSSDYDDPSTFIDVTYSERLGIILKKRLSKEQGYGGQESFLGDVQNFYKACGINEWDGIDEHKKYSIY